MRPEHHDARPWVPQPSRLRDLGLRLSDHAWRRMHARRIGVEAIVAALRCGREVRSGDRFVYAIGRREVLDARLLGEDLEPHEGVHVIVAGDTIVTVYRDRTLRRLRRCCMRRRCRRRVRRAATPQDIRVHLQHAS